MELIKIGHFFNIKVFKNQCCKKMSIMKVFLLIFYIRKKMRKKKVISEWKLLYIGWFSNSEIVHQHLFDHKLWIWLARVSIQVHRQVLVTFTLFNKFIRFLHQLGSLIFSMNLNSWKFLIDQKQCFISVSTEKKNHNKIRRFGFRNVGISRLVKTSDEFFNKEEF